MSPSTSSETRGRAGQGTRGRARARRRRLRLGDDRRTAEVPGRGEAEAHLCRVEQRTGTVSSAVSNAGVIVSGKNVQIGCQSYVSIAGGLILLNIPPGVPPLPPMAALHGPGGPATVPSPRSLSEPNPWPESLSLPRAFQCGSSETRSPSVSRGRDGDDRGQIYPTKGLGAAHIEKPWSRGGSGGRTDGRRRRREGGRGGTRRRRGRTLGRRRGLVADFWRRERTCWRGGSEVGCLLRGRPRRCRGSGSCRPDMWQARCRGPSLRPWSSCRRCRRPGGGRMSPSNSWAASCRPLRLRRG